MVQRFSVARTGSEFSADFAGQVFCLDSFRSETPHYSEVVSRVP